MVACVPVSQDGDEDEAVVVEVVKEGEVGTRPSQK